MLYNDFDARLLLLVSRRVTVSNKRHCLFHRLGEMRGPGCLFETSFEPTFTLILSRILPPLKFLSTPARSANLLPTKPANLSHLVHQTTMNLSLSNRTALTVLFSLHSVAATPPGPIYLTTRRLLRRPWHQRPPLQPVQVN